MSDLQWITINNRLQQGASLINNLNTKRYELLLSHIINSSSDDYFTETELQKLQDNLKLDENQLQLLVQSIAYIYKQSRRVILKPTELESQLVEKIGLDQGKAEIFTKQWLAETKKELGAFEDRHTLNSLKWELNMQVASDMGNKQVIPNAKIQLDLTKVTDETKKEAAILEMGEEDLQQLYSTLEAIQLRLDNISKNKASQPNSAHKKE
ncbi:uncharacterized protein LOC125503579 [Dendroctonus ponderosae]|uniref:COMM domain-containing protein n=1 Tax=Dendroctonus ponderosae TaxID=77166 RepID=J3JYM1_DENPD